MKGLKTKIGFVALGGHIITQNLTFRSIIKTLGTQSYEFYGLEDGFRVFDTGNLHVLGLESFVDGYQRVMPGFYSGSSSDNKFSIADNNGHQIPERIERAIDFIRQSRLDYIVGSGGDVSGLQLKVLSDAIKDSCLEWCESGKWW